MQTLFTKENMKKTTPKPKFVSLLDDIQSICVKPVKIYFSMNGTDCMIPTRHLTPSESELLKLQLDELIPPMIKGKTEAEDRIDVGNVAYIQKKTKIERQVRAQAIFWATDSFKKKKPELVEAMYSAANRQAITDFVQSFLTEDILDLIYAGITTPQINAVDPDKINFTSPGG